MKKHLLIFLFSGLLFANDIIIKTSDFSVTETIENINKIVVAKGFTVFAVIDHQSGAKKLGMKLNESKVIIFGNPKIGTKIMQEDMTSALDLPLRVLVFKAKDAETKIAYRDGSWIKNNHSLKSDTLTNKINNGLDKITNKARLKRW